MIKRVFELEPEKRVREWIARCKKSGWMARRGSEDMVESGPAVYLVDIKSQKMFFLQTALGEIERNVAEIKKDGYVHQDSVEMLSDGLDVLAKKELNDVERKVLAGAMELYLYGTNSYQLASDHNERRHFIIARYPDVSNGSWWIRPFIALSNDILSPDRVAAAANQMLAIDRQTHPERFNKSAKILEFRIKNTTPL